MKEQKIYHFLSLRLAYRRATSLVRGRLWIGANGKTNPHLLSVSTFYF